MIVEAFLLVAAAVSVVVLAQNKSLGAAEVRKLLAKRKLQPIAQLVDGEPGTVRGTIAFVEPTAHVLTPIDKTPCVYWRVVFDEVGTGTDFEELGRVEAGVPFLLRSSEGTARVVPDKPLFAIKIKTTMQHSAGGFGGDALGELARTCARHPHHADTMIRATEYVLVEGDEVTVSGWVTREQDPEAAENVAGYRADLPTRPVISGSRKARLLISD